MVEENAVPEDFKAQYQILGDLKRIEEKIFRLRTEIDRIPEEIATLDSSLSKRKEQFDGLKGQFDSQEKSVRKAEADIRERDDLYRKAESKMMEVKTNEEYRAALRENETIKEAKAELEEKALQMMGELEEKRKLLQAAEGEYTEFKKKIEEDKARLETERKSIVRSYEELVEKRNSFCTSLDKDIASLYQKVSGTAPKGVPIVQAKNGMCVGCNMKIRPQLYNEILGFRAIHRCPSCGRILVVSLDDTATNAAQ